MSEDNAAHEEQPLKALFDLTSEPVDNAALQRLARAAALIPERAEQAGSGWGQWWARVVRGRVWWLAAGASALVAIVYLGWGGAGTATQLALEPNVGARIAGALPSMPEVPQAPLRVADDEGLEDTEEWDDEDEALFAALADDDLGDADEGADLWEFGFMPPAAAAGDPVAAVDLLALPDDPDALDAMHDVYTALLSDG